MTRGVQIEDIEIFFDEQERREYFNQTKETSMEFLKEHFPQAFEHLEERQRKIIANQKHFAELKAMCHFTEEGCSVFYVESGFITRFNTKIKEVIETHFSPEQAAYILKYKHGGVPDLLVGKNGKWVFFEAKKEGDKRTKLQQKTFQEMRDFGIDIRYIYVRPIRA